jgi:hypothetical protein
VNVHGSFHPLESVRVIIGVCVSRIFDFQFDFFDISLNQKGGRRLVFFTFFFWQKKKEKEGSRNKRF